MEIQGQWPTRSPYQRIHAYHQLNSGIKHLPTEKAYRTIDHLLQWASMDQVPSGRSPILNRDQLKILSRSQVIEIGAHTLTHPRLTSLPELEQNEEIRSSKSRLEKLIESPVRLFSYPYGAPGDFNAVTIRLVHQAQFSAAVSNIQKTLDADDSALAIPRLLVRNWSGKSFSTWMDSPEAVGLEKQSLQERDIRLKQWFQQEKSA